MAEWPFAVWLFAVGLKRRKGVQLATRLSHCSGEAPFVPAVKPKTLHVLENVEVTGVVAGSRVVGKVSRLQFEEAGGCSRRPHHQHLHQESPEVALLQL